MNWLAHLLLSEPTPEFRLGNLLPDLLGPAEYAGMPPAVMRGVACHRFIDRFTDTHPLVRQSIRRVPAPYTRVAGILVDVFYDHLLAVYWPTYCDVPLEEFTRQVYRGFVEVESLISADLASRLLRLARADILGSYRTPAGIEIALRRIGARMRGGYPLEQALPALQERYHELHGDFAVFFPELRQKVGELTLL